MLEARRRCRLLEREERRGGMKAACDHEMEGWRRNQPNGSLRLAALHSPHRRLENQSVFAFSAFFPASPRLLGKSYSPNGRLMALLEVPHY
jgi:hypothetical protein